MGTYDAIASQAKRVSKSDVNAKIIHNFEIQSSLACTTKCVVSEVGKNGEFVLNVSNLTTCTKLIRTYTTHVQKNTSLYIFAIHLFIYTFCIPFLALVEVVVMKITAFFTWGGAYDVSYLYSPERQWRMKEQQSKSETWHEYDKEMEQNNAVDVSENRKRKQVRCRKIEK